MRKYKIELTTAPSNTYKTKEEADLMIEKATDIIVKYLIDEFNEMEEVRKKTTD